MNDELKNALIKFVELIARFIKVAVFIFILMIALAVISGILGGTAEANTDISAQYSKDFRCASLVAESYEEQRKLFLELESEVIERHKWLRIPESVHYTKSIESACMRSPFSKMGEKIYHYYKIYSGLSK
jgi:hypothetical protein